MRKSNKGITLIALIITIIVLLILAGITIGALTSNNSVLKQAGSAKNETGSIQEAEKVQLAVHDATINVTQTVNGELTTEAVNKGLKGQFGEEAEAEGDGPWTYTGEYKIYEIDKIGTISEAKAIKNKDSEGKDYYLPEGAKYKEGTVDTGLVITYKESEFVWIPINKNLTVQGTNKPMAKKTEGTDDKGNDKYQSVLYSYSIDETGVVSNENANYNQNNVNSYREPADLQDTDEGDWSITSSRGINLMIEHIKEFKNLDNTTENQEVIKTRWIKQLQEEYDEMIQSIIRYEGFYVGRYETSLVNGKVASVPGENPFSSHTTEGDSWYGLYQKQKEFVSDSDKVISNMIWGSQYDAILNWIIATGSDKEKIMQTTNGNHGGNALKCGEYGNGSDKMNNIFDLEGNLYEWTQECYGPKHRVRRGGNYGFSFNSTNRLGADFGGSPFYSLYTYGSRMTLYIKR